MNQFYWQQPQTQAKTPSSGPSSTTVAAAIELLPFKHNNLPKHQAKIEVQQTQHNNTQTLVKIAVVQANGKTVNISQPLAQLPTSLATNLATTLGNSQNLAITAAVGKHGQIELSFFPQHSQAINQSAQAPTTTTKIPLSDKQLLGLLRLNSAYQVVKEQKGNASAVVQTQGQIKQSPANTMVLKLPGLPTPVKLPENIASLLLGQKTIAVELSAKNNNIQLQLNLADKKGKTTPLLMNVTGQKITPIIKSALKQSSDIPLKVLPQPSGGDKVEVAKQTLTLATKVTVNSQLKLDNISSTGLTVKITSPPSQVKALSTVELPAPQLSQGLKQLLIAQQKAQLTAGAELKINSAPTKASSDKLSPQLGSQTDAPQTHASELSPAPVDYKVQKQQLAQFIDPLIRLLLPKKLSWSEGFKALNTLSQQIPNDKPLTTGEQAQPLKQLLEQLKSAIPDHKTPLDQKTIANLIGQLLNYNPVKMTAPSSQPTPANAIASALQLLLGAKVAQTEAKLSPQLSQQLTQLLTPTSNKNNKGGKEIKNLTRLLIQTEQSSGALKSLSAIQSGVRQQQLENVEKKLDGNQQLNLNLPLKVDGEVKELQIAINEEKAQADKDNKRLSVWQLNLTFDLNELGKLMANAKLKEGELSLHLYAEQAQTLSLMNQFSDTLAERLEFHGVKINNIVSSLGKINENKGNKQLNSLLQIKV